MFDVYDKNGNWRGVYPRKECHGNPELIHRVVHVVVFDSTGKKILLQKRSVNKDIQPGKWDTAVGGHVNAGEKLDDAACRELREELGITGKVEFFFESEIRNEIESENVTVYKLFSDGPFEFAADEIDEIRFWELADFQSTANCQRSVFTPNLQVELQRVVELLKK